VNNWNSKYHKLTTSSLSHQLYVHPVEPQNHINPAIRIHNDAQGLRWRKPQQTEVTVGPNMTVVILKAALLQMSLWFTATYTHFSYCYTHDNELIDIKISQNSLRPLCIVTRCQGSLTVIWSLIHCSSHRTQSWSDCYSSVGTMTRLQPRKPRTRVSITGREQTLLVSSLLFRAQASYEAHTAYLVCTSVPVPETANCRYDHSPLSNVDINNAWSSTSTLPDIFM